MAGFPCHGLRALSTVLASADTHAALEKKAGSLMVSLTGRRDAKRLQAIVANLYVRDGVVYARSDVQVHEQLVVPKEVSLFVVCMAAVTITVNTLKKTTRTKHNALFSSQAVVQLLAKHGFYAGVKKSGNLGVEQVSPLIDAFQDRIDDLLDATVVAHKALPTGNDVCAQVKAVYDVLTSIGWRDLPTNPDVTRAFLKSERDVLFGPPGDAGRRFVFSIAGEQHVCWTRYRHDAVAAASKARGIHVYYCHRWREPRHTSTHPSGTPGMSQAHEEKEKEKEKETSDSNVNGVDVDDNSNSLSAPADVSSSRAFVDDMAPHESIIAAVLPFDEAVHDGSDSDSEDDGDEGDGSHGIDVAEDSGVTQQLSTIPKHLLPPSFPDLRGAPDVPVPPPPPATDPPRPAPSRTARERRSLNTHKGCSCRAKLVVIEGKEAIALVACHDHTGHTVGSVEDRKHLPVHPAVERMIADQASKRCTLLSRGEVAKYASSCRLTYVKHRRRVLFENETRSASLPGYAPGTSAASPAFEVRKRGDLLQSVTEHRKAFCLCNSFLPPSEHGAVPVVTCMTCCDVYHVSCVSNALWYDHGVDHDTWRCQPCVKNGTARMSDALNMCAESGLPFNISDFRPWVTKEDFKNSRKAVNASSRSYRSSVDDDIRVLQQYHESVAFPSTYIRTCEMANTTKLQELEFMVISPKMLAFAKKNRGVLSVLHIDFTHNTTTSSVQLGSIVGANADTRGTGIPLGHMFYLPGSVQTQYNDKTSALYNVYNAWSEAIDAGIDGYRVTRCHMMDKDVASLNATLMLMKKRLRSALHRNKDVLDAEIHTLSSMPCMSDDGTAKAVAETHGLLAPHVSELFDAGVVHGLAHLLVAEFHAASAKLISADSCGKWNNAASELWWCLSILNKDFRYLNNDWLCDTYAPLILQSYRAPIPRNLLQVLVGTPTAPDPLNSVIGVKLQDVDHMRLGVSCESKNYKATRLTAKIDVLRLRLHNDDGPSSHIADGDIQVSRAAHFSAKSTASDEKERVIQLKGIVGAIVPHHAMGLFEHSTDVLRIADAVHKSAFVKHFSALHRISKYRIADAMRHAPTRLHERVATILAKPPATRTHEHLRQAFYHLGMPVVEKWHGMPRVGACYVVMVVMAPQVLVGAVDFAKEQPEALALDVLSVLFSAFDYVQARPKAQALENVTLFYVGRELRNVHALKRVLDHGTKSGSPILHHFVGASKGWVTEPFGAVAVERRFVAFTPPSTQMLDIAEAAWHVVLLECAMPCVANTSPGGDPHGHRFLHDTHVATSGIMRMGHDRLRDHGVKAISEMKLSSEQNPFMKRALVASSRTLRLTRGRGEADADVGEDLWWDAWCNAVDGNQEEHTVHLWCNICSCGNTFCAHLMLARKRHEDMFHRVQVWDDDMLSLYKGQAHRDGGADTWTELDEAGFEYGPCNSPSEEPLAPFQSHVPASPDMRQSLEEASMCAYAVSLSLAKMANGECDTVTPKAAADYRDRLFAMLSSIRNVERGVVGVRAQSEHWMTRSATASDVQMSNAAARDVHSSDFHEIMRSALSSGAHARLFTFMKGVVGPTATPSATQTQASPCQNLVNAAMQAIAELPSETVTPSPPVAARRASKGKEKALSQTEEHVLPSQVLPSPTETGSQPATRKSLHVTFTQESDVHIAPTPEECKRHFLAVLRRDAFDELVYVTEEEFNKFSVHTKEWYDTQVLKANILECGIKDIVSGHHLWTLKPGGWLKDSIVTYMLYCVLASVKVPHERDEKGVFRPNTLVHMHCALLSDTNQSFDNKKKLKDKMNKAKRWLCVVCNDVHYSLVSVNCESGAIQHYDSCPGLHTSETVLTFCKTMFGRRFRDMSYEVVECPKQNNGFDCALYTALNVEAVLLDVSPNVVTQRRVNELRKSTRVKLKDCFLGQEQDWWVEEEDDDEVAAKIEELHTVGHVLVHVMSDADAWKIHHALVTTLANNTLVAWDGIFDNVVAQDAQDGQETFERDMINVNDAFTNHVTGGEDLLQRIESYHNRVDRYMGGRTCPEGAVLLRSCPERAGNNARTGLPNFKKGPCQAPHVDYTDVYEDVADDDVPLVVIIAIQEGTKVRIWPESTKGKGIWIAKKKKNENLTKGLLDYVDVHIPVGYALIMRGDLVHAGVGYDIVQLRLHKEYKHHSKKKGVCKKYNPQTALWHPELFKELYKSGKIT
ncbi:hypothetical protein NFJ02_07g131370 [Pycnococcus provasolii]